MQDSSIPQKEGGHRLHSEWAFWEHKEIKKGASDEEWSNAAGQLTNFNTIEQFWAIWNNVPAPSELFFNGKQKRKLVRSGAIEALSIFKRGIRPEWEDPCNKDGGELRKAVTLDQLDTVWEAVVLNLIGESMDPDNEVCGARIVDKSYQTDRGGSRPSYRLEVWYRNKRKSEMNELIKTNLRSCLKNRDGIPDTSKIDMKNH
jgi:hypothetical protein